MRRRPKTWSRRTNKCCANFSWWCSRIFCRERRRDDNAINLEHQKRSAATTVRSRLLTATNFHSLDVLQPVIHIFAHLCILHFCTAQKYDYADIWLVCVLIFLYSHPDIKEWISGAPNKWISVWHAQKLVSCDWTLHSISGNHFLARCLVFPLSSK